MSIEPTVTAFCMVGGHPAEELTVNGDLPAGWTKVRATMQTLNGHWMADPNSPASILHCPAHPVDAYQPSRKTNWDGKIWVLVTFSLPTEVEVFDQDPSKTIELEVNQVLYEANINGGDSREVR